MGYFLINFGLLFHPSSGHAVSMLSLPLRSCSSKLGVDQTFFVTRAQRVDVVGRHLPVVVGRVYELLLTRLRVANLVGLASVAIFLQRVLRRVGDAEELACSSRNSFVNNGKTFFFVIYGKMAVNYGILAIYAKISGKNLTVINGSVMFYGTGPSTRSTIGIGIY